ncbi:MAG: response regulator [Candidatus Eisenbacteria bacterium]
MTEEKKKRIIFVDDETNVLDGLRRMLRPMRNEWDMAFVTTGGEALQSMEVQPYDVVVSDMRMPTMDGAELLKAVIARWPETIRFVLSGQSDNETILRSIGPAHQYMSKPCDADILKSTIARAFALRGVLKSKELKELVSQINSLPSLPDLFVRVQDELSSEDASVRRVGELIEQDVAMSAKILQLVNSAFFGLSSPVTSPAHAVSLLGLDLMKSLVLVVHVFSEANAPHFPGLSVETLHHHSLSVASFARAIARAETSERSISDHAFLAGALHDMGRLILMANMPDRYRTVIGRVRDEGVSLLKAEKEEFGATHSSVGAYLLGLWGFPDPVVEAAVFHHAPRQSLCAVFSALTAVHAANVIEYETRAAGPLGDAPLFDEEYLESIRLSDRPDSWRNLCEPFDRREEAETTAGGATG